MRLDDLYLWYLGDPASPRYVGALKLVSAAKGVSLHYGEEWLAKAKGFALSEDLPLVDNEFLTPGRLAAVAQRAVGAVGDARPDRWGQKVIRFVHRPKRLSLIRRVTGFERCSVGTETPIRFAQVFNDSLRRKRATARSAPSFSMAPLPIQCTAVWALGPSSAVASLRHTAAGALATHAVLKRDKGITGR